MKSFLTCSPQKIHRISPAIFPITPLSAHYATSNFASLSPAHHTPHNSHLEELRPNFRTTHNQLDELRPIFRTVSISSQNGNHSFPTSTREWRDKFLATYNVRTVMNDRKMESFLYTWRHDWECFWDESDVPLDPNKDYIFKHHLEMWESGFVHSPDHFDEFGDYLNYSDLCKDFSLLEELKQLANSNEGSQWHAPKFPLLPIIIKFDKTKELTPQNVLKSLLAHENLTRNESITKTRFSEATQHIEAWFKKHFGDSYVAFQSGAQLVNPVPWLCVGKTKTGNLVGFISALDIPREHKIINWA